MVSVIIILGFIYICYKRRKEKNNTDKDPSQIQQNNIINNNYPYNMNYPVIPYPPNNFQFNNINNFGSNNEPFPSHIPIDPIIINNNNINNNNQHIVDRRNSNLKESETINVIQKKYSVLEDKNFKEQIKDLKKKCYEIIIMDNVKESIILNFTSLDQKLKCAIICNKNDNRKFNEIVNNIYEKFPEFKMSPGFFTCTGIKINEYLSLKENKIKDSAGIIFNDID